MGLSPRDIAERLSPFLTDERKARIEEVLRYRVRGIVPVMENISDLGNVNAVMRSAESVGCLEVHLLETRLEDRIRTSNRSASGAEKWLQVARFTETGQAVSHLRSRGYRIAVTSLDATETLETLDVSRPIAVVFGNEHAGVSAEIAAAADLAFKIPMLGFTQSFNISVAAALTLKNLTDRYRARLRTLSDLTDDEASRVRAEYYRLSLPYADAVLNRGNAPCDPTLQQPL